MKSKEQIYSHQSYQIPKIYCLTAAYYWFTQTNLFRHYNKV